MSDSLQKWVGRNRPPRVQITYDVEIGDAIEKKELPLVVGLMADLSGQPATPLPKLKERRFVEIDRDNFNEVMGKISPRLDLSVPDTLKGEGNLKIELGFKEFEDRIKSGASELENEQSYERMVLIDWIMQFNQGLNRGNFPFDKLFRDHDSS